MIIVSAFPVRTVKLKGPSLNQKKKKKKRLGPQTKHQPEENKASCPTPQVRAGGHMTAGLDRWTIKTWA